MENEVFYFFMLMKKYFFFLLLLSRLANGQTLYSKAFGRSTDQPVIFLHGGPGSSAVYFEATTAQKLSEQGFYVIIYDRRGEGRSKDNHAKMNFEEAFHDLTSIYAQYGIKKASLIGFSFGGLVTAQFAERFPEKINTIVLVSALVSQQKSYDTILKSSKAIYEKSGTISIFRILKEFQLWTPARSNTEPAALNMLHRTAISS